MGKSFWIPLTAAFGTIFVLYLIGSIAGLDAFAFKMSLTYTEISLVPIVIGLLVGFISERIMKTKHAD